MKRILILYTSIGLGHKIIAENIGYQLEHQGFEVRLEDTLRVQKGWLVSFAKAVHAFINEYLPFVWSWLYHFTNSTWGSWTLRLRTRIASQHYGALKNILDEFQPHVVISTQATPSAIVDYLKHEGLYRGLFGIAFSDFHLHRYWLYNSADFYLANIEEQKKRMETLGVPSSKIFVCGITLKPLVPVEKKRVLEKFGFSTSNKIAVLASGSLGIGFKMSVLRALLSESSVRVVVVCGKNQELLHTLKDEWASEPRVTVVGYYEPMDELYAIADVLVSKPGGLTTAEALRWNLPMLVTHLLPGQEELNVKYLRKFNLILPLTSTPQTIVQELQTGKFKTALQTNPKVVEITAAQGLDEMVKTYLQ